MDAVFNVRAVTNATRGQATASGSIFSDTTNDQVRLVGVVNGKLRAGNATFHTQLRPRSYFAPGSSGTTHDSEIVVDQLFGEWMMNPTTFVAAGRRQIVNGVGLGYNPTDFLNVSKEQDRTLPDEIRRAERRGDDLVELSKFFLGGSGRLIYSPAQNGESHDRALAQFSKTIESLNSDVTVIGYYGDRPSLGLNLAATVSDTTVAYVEAAGRWGRDRASVETASGGQHSLERDSNGFYADAVIGFQRTFASGLNVNVEYWDNQNGYSGEELDRIRSALRRGPSSLPQARSLLGTLNLRPHKVFVRLSGLKFKDETVVELTGIQSLDDGSRFLRAAVTARVSANTSVRVGADVFSGRAASEYGQNPVSKRLFVGYRMQF